MRPILIGAIIALSTTTLAVAGEEPVRTVAKLDAKDPKYDTQACKVARAQAIDYQEPGGLMRKAVSMGGNAVVPFAGTVANTALGLKSNTKQDKLSKAVAVACVSDPLNEETPLISAPKAEQKAETHATPRLIAAQPAVREVAAPTVAATETLAISQ
jgi:hypothetical protein